MTKLAQGRKVRTLIDLDLRSYALHYHLEVDKLCDSKGAATEEARTKLGFDLQETRVAWRRAGLNLNTVFEIVSVPGFKVNLPHQDKRLRLSWTFNLENFASMQGISADELIDGDGNETSLCRLLLNKEIVVGILTHYQRDNIPAIVESSVLPRE